MDGGTLTGIQGWGPITIRALATETTKPGKMPGFEVKLSGPGSATVTAVVVVVMVMAVVTATARIVAAAVVIARPHHNPYGCRRVVHGCRLVIDRSGGIDHRRGRRIVSRTAVITDTYDWQTDAYAHVNVASEGRRHGHAAEQHGTRQDDTLDGGKL
jgi:hypothetical protein